MTRYFPGVLLLATTFALRAQPIPTLVEKGGRHALLVDGKPFLILGAQAHNSSAWPAFLPQVWTAVNSIYANTLELPVYWEQVEPEPDHFDFSLVDSILSQARQNQKHLILLWFATWKNGSNHYMPTWMKLHPDEYPNCHAGGRQKGLCRRHAPPPDSRSRANRDHGPGRKRTRILV